MLATHPHRSLALNRCHAWKDPTSTARRGGLLRQKATWTKRRILTCSAAVVAGCSRAALRPRRCRVVRQASSSAGSDAATKLTSKINDAKSPIDLATLCWQHMMDATWNEVHLSAMFLRLAHPSFTLDATVQSSGLLHMLVKKTEDMVKEDLLDARQAVHIIVGAIAKLRASTPGLMQSVPALHEAIATSLDGAPDALEERELSELVLASARLHAVNDRLVDSVNGKIEPIVAALVSRVKQTPDKFKARDLSNILWALAHLRLDAQIVAPVVAVATDRIREAPGDFGAARLANT
eukprot:3097063-Amphidinium_carterae.1